MVARPKIQDATARRHSAKERLLAGAGVRVAWGYGFPERLPIRALRNPQAPPVTINNAHTIQEAGSGKGGCGATGPKSTAGMFAV